MAEEIINPMVTCEKIESDGNSSGKNSTRTPSSPDNECGILPHGNRTSSDSFHDFTNSRRNSTGKPNSQNGNQKIVPHYLRASTGSCHDFCKYGRKHAFEEKERRPFLKSIIRAPSDMQNPAETLSLRERKKATVLKQMISPCMKSHSLELGALPGAVHSADPPQTIKQKVMLPSRPVEVSPNCGPLSHKKSNAEKRTNNFPSKQSPPVRPLTKQSSSFQTLKPAKKVEKAEKTSNLSLKCSPSSGSQPSTKKIEKAEKTMNNSQKYCPPAVPQRAVSKSSSLFRTPQSTNGRGKLKGDVKASKNVVATKASAKKVLATSTASLSTKLSINRNVTLKAKKNRSLKVVSPTKDHNRIQKPEIEKADSENAPEKTLHVVVEEIKNNISQSTEDSHVAPSLAPPSFPSPKSLSQPESASFSSLEGGGGGGGEEEEEEEEEHEICNDIDYEEEEIEDGNASTCETNGNFISNKNRTANNNTKKTVGGNPSKTTRKGFVFSESKDPTPVKLKFKRGKIVDLQSETNGTRRLRFRRGRLMEENYDRRSEMRKNFKKKILDGDGNGTEPNKEKVLLRHQNMQGRKDAQGLFNNVIEETASKLVESRKSKVKALVGAFETVISLQDTKPSPQTIS